eukprot:1766638-Rhodomonas_salina.1
MDAATAKEANQRFLVKAQRFAFYRGAMRYIAHWKGLIQRHKTKQAAAQMFAKGSQSTLDLCRGRTHNLRSHRAGNVDCVFNFALYHDHSCNNSQVPSFGALTHCGLSSGKLSKPFMEFRARIQKQQLLRAIFKEVVNTGLTGTSPT